MCVHKMYVLFAPAYIYFSVERKSALVVFLDTALPDLESFVSRQVSLDNIFVMLQSCLLLDRSVIESCSNSIY